MKYVKSCGFVVYKRNENKNLYLIIKGLNGDVGFPKGHMEADESELETAVRELKEETGVDVDVIQGFRHMIEYKLNNAGNTLKQAVYFLGKAKSDSIICQESEIAEANFVPYENAMEMLTFAETKKILANAESFLDTHLP